MTHSTVSEHMHDQRLRPVVEAFSQSQYPGASLAVWRDGRPLVVCCGGQADVSGTRPWDETTLVQVYSAGKPVAALAALSAIAQGAFGLDTPVADIWPEYRDSLTHPTTVRMILAHTAGKPVFSPAAAQLDPTDADGLIRDLADQPPLWEPGTRIAEHAGTYGHLIDGLLRAAHRPSISATAAKISHLLGIRLRFGLAPHELPMAADLEIIDPGWTDSYLARPLSADALLRPAGLLDPNYLNSDVWRATSFGAVGLHTDAVSLARFYDDAHRADGAIARLLGADLWSAMMITQAAGHDLFLDDAADWGLGFSIEDGFGMGGLGGSSGWYSKSLNYSLGYVTRGLANHDRVNHIADVLEECLRIIDREKGENLG